MKPETYRPFMIGVGVTGIILNLAAAFGAHNMRVEHQKEIKALQEAHRSEIAHIQKHPVKITVYGNTYEFDQKGVLKQ